MDKQHRPFRLFQRQHWESGLPAETLLKEDLDDLFWCGVYKSLDGKYVFFEAASKETPSLSPCRSPTMSKTAIACRSPTMSKPSRRISYDYYYAYEYDHIIDHGTDHDHDHDPDNDHDPDHDYDDALLIWLHVNIEVTLTIEVNKNVDNKIELC